MKQFSFNDSIDSIKFYIFTLAGEKVSFNDFIEKLDSIGFEYEIIELDYPFGDLVFTPDCSHWGRWRDLKQFIPVWQQEHGLDRILILDSDIYVYNSIRPIYHEDFRDKWILQTALIKSDNPLRNNRPYGMCYLVDCTRDYKSKIELLTKHFREPIRFSDEEILNIAINKNNEIGLTRNIDLIALNLEDINILGFEQYDKTLVHCRTKKPWHKGVQNYMFDQILHPPSNRILVHFSMLNCVKNMPYSWYNMIKKNKHMFDFVVIVDEGFPYKREDIKNLRYVTVPKEGDSFIDPYYNRFLEFGKGDYDYHIIANVNSNPCVLQCQCLNTIKAASYCSSFDSTSAIYQSNGFSMFSKKQIDEFFYDEFYDKTQFQFYYLDEVLSTKMLIKLSLSKNVCSQLVYSNNPVDDELLTFGYQARQNEEQHHRPFRQKNFQMPNNFDVEDSWCKVQLIEQQLQSQPRKNISIDYGLNDYKILYYGKGLMIEQDGKIAPHRLMFERGSNKVIKVFDFNGDFNSDIEVSIMALKEYKNGLPKIRFCNPSNIYIDKIYDI